MVDGYTPQVLLYCFTVPTCTVNTVYRLQHAKHAGKLIAINHRDHRDGDHDDCVSFIAMTGDLQFTQVLASPILHLS